MCNVVPGKTTYQVSKAELRELELQASDIQHLVDRGPGSEDEVGSEEDLDSDILDVGNLSLGPGPGEESG